MQNWDSVFKGPAMSLYASITVYCILKLMYAQKDMYAAK